MIKRHSLRHKLLAVIGVLMFFILSVLSASIYKANALDFHGIDVSNLESITGYYMSINFNGEIGKQSIDKQADNALFYDCNLWTRTTLEASYIVEFPNIKFEDGKHLTYFATLTAEYPARMYFGTKVVFKTNVDVNLSNNVYKYLQKLEKEKRADYSNILLTVYKDSKSTQIKLPTANKIAETVKLYTSENDISKIDPDSDNFDINFGNTGDVGTKETTATNKQSWGERFLDWLSTLLNISTMAATVVVIIIIGVFGYKLLKNKS